MQWLFRLLGISEDQLREVRIEQYHQTMLTSDNVGERLEAWRCMQAEIQNRSPAQLERMEKERADA